MQAHMSPASNLSDALPPPIRIGDRRNSAARIYPLRAPALPGIGPRKRSIAAPCGSTNRSLPVRSSGEKRRTT